MVVVMVVVVVVVVVVVAVDFVVAVMVVVVWLLACPTLGLYHETRQFERDSEWASDEEQTARSGSSPLTNRGKLGDSNCNSVCESV